MIGWTGDGDSDDGEGSADENGSADEDVPTAQESTWASLMRKASGTLIGKSPAKPYDNDALEDSEHGQHSRRGSGSQSSFLSARSAESLSVETTPTHSRQASGEPSTVSPGRHTSFKGEPGTSAVRRRSSMRKQRRRASAAAPAVVKRINPVLERLETYDRDSDFDAPWTKMILLEEIGTASSWTILLLPYIAFIVSVLLDTHSAFMVTSVGPLNATTYCNNATASSTYDVPIKPAAVESCSYPYALETGHGILTSGKNSFLLQTFHYKDLMKTGMAFTSGPITGVSPMSTFLNGDLFFHGLSTDAVMVVAKGTMMVSTVILQRLSDHAVDWAPVFVSRPERLSLACIPNVAEHEKPTTTSRWNCTSPGIVDVVFPMPGTGVLNGGELQVYLLYSSYDSSSASAQEFFHGTAPYKDANGTGSFVFDESGAETFGSHDNAPTSDALVSRMVRSSVYVFEHESVNYARVKISMRLFTLSVTLIFTLFWCWSLGIKGFFLGCSYSGGSCWPGGHNEEDTLPLTGRQRKGMYCIALCYPFASRTLLLAWLTYCSLSLCHHRLDVVGVAMDCVSGTQIFACPSHLFDADSKPVACIRLL